MVDTILKKPSINTG